MMFRSWRALRRVGQGSQTDDERAMLVSRSNCWADVANKQPKRKDRPGVDRYGRTDLHYAAADGNLEKVAFLLSAGANAAAPDDEGWTPLHAAVQAWSSAICVALLDAGAAVDAQDVHGNTPLSKAVFESRGRGELIGLLRARGANPLLKNRHGVSPLKLARTIANFDVRQFFADLPDLDEP
jgi:ankyrin repeat protein